MLSAVILACGLAASVWENRQANKDAQVVWRVGQLLSTLKDTETGQRGYLITGAGYYLEPYIEGIGRLPADFASVEAVLGHGPELGRLHDLVAAKLAELADTIAKHQSGASTEALAVVRSDYGKQTMDAIRREIAQLSDAASVDAAARTRRAEVALIVAIAGGFALLLLCLASVSRLVRTRDLLAASESRMKLLVAGIYDHAIYMLDDHGRILTWNTGAERLKGFTATEAIGLPYAMLFAPEERRAGLPETLLARAREAGSIECEGRRIRRDGTIFTAHVSLTALFDDAGKLSGYCKVMRDVTDQRAAEMVLARDRAELEKLVQERTATLRDMQNRLAHVQRMEALGQLAGGIAHDFNNVLQAVEGSVALIRRFPKDPDKVSHLAASVTTMVERGSAITRRLLAFSRRGDLRTETVDARLMLADLREMLMRTLGTGITVNIAAPGILPLMTVDKGQLETVLINLVANARDAMSENGFLTLGATADEVVPGGASGRPDRLQAGSYLRLSVADTGIGMTPEVLRRVTEPFFTTKPQGKGTGLGLAMARGFIEQSGGGLHIESAPGQGTTVTLWVPCAKGEVVQATPRWSAQPEIATNHARIMLVDDDDIVRDVMAQQLEDLGYVVLAAAGGSEALALLDQGRPVDVLVSDLSMPHMDGIACINEVHRRRPKLPCILLTGFASNVVEIAMQRGLGSDFSLLRKPVTILQLTERIETLLNETAKYSSEISDYVA